MGGCAGYPRFCPGGGGLWSFAWETPGPDWGIVGLSIYCGQYCEQRLKHYLPVTLGCGWQKINFIWIATVTRNIEGSQRGEVWFCFLTFSNKATNFQRQMSTKQQIFPKTSAIRVKYMQKIHLVLKGQSCNKKPVWYQWQYHEYKFIRMLWIWILDGILSTFVHYLLIETLNLHCVEEPCVR